MSDEQATDPERPRGRRLPDGGPVGTRGTGSTGGILAVVMVGICAVIAIAVFAGTHASSGAEDDAWDDCIAEEQARIDEEGSLLEAEDFCSIRYPGHDES